MTHSARTSIVCFLLLTTLLFAVSTNGWGWEGGGPGEGIHGQVFYDVNGNGQKDIQEQGLPNWIVYLDLDDNGQFDPGEDVHTLTDRCGWFRFPFPPESEGVLRVREVVQPGWLQTSPPAEPEGGSFNQTLDDPPPRLPPMLFGNDLVEGEQLLFITGRKFHDRNGNGERDFDEEGLPGWTIYLDLDNNGHFELGQDIHTVTGGHGHYLFAAAASEAPYMVREMLKAGWEATVPVQSGDLDPGTEVGAPDPGSVEIVGVDFGNRRNGEAGVIAGRKFRDRNRNGALDDGEPGLPDWVIYVDLNRNKRLDRMSGEEERGEPWTTTGDAGHYEFHLPPGEYSIREVNRPGWQQTLPAWEDHFHYDIELEPGAVLDGKHFGNVPIEGRPSVLTGLKFLDRDGNGEREEGEPVLPHWRIYLDANRNGGYDFGEPMTHTMNDGRYSFDVASGVHYVREILPAPPEGAAVQWVQTQPGAAMDYCYEVTVEEEGTVIEGLVFGNHIDCDTLGVVSGRKFEDLDGNGDWNGEETALSGWLIYIDLNRNRRFDPGLDPHRRTDENGAYEFALAPGIYLVREQLRGEGWRQTCPGIEDNFEYVVELESGTVLEELDFGNRHVEQRPAVISGRKYADRNDNGEWNEGEPGLRGWLIYLDINRNGRLDEEWSTEEAVDRWTRTDTNGHYRFVVPPGEYAVREVILPGWRQTEPGPDSWEHVVAVESGDHAEGVNFGNLREEGFLPIFGHKFADLDGNGKQGEGERSLPGWLVYLDLNNNDEYDEEFDRAVRTDDRGRFSFEISEAGVYHLREAARDGWRQTVPGQPSFEYEVRRPSEEAMPCIFGNQPLERPARLAGCKFLDLNLNGVMDSGERGLPGWLIYLDLNGNDRYDEETDIGVETSDSGHYAFEVRPGEYAVREVLREGWLQTVPDDEYRVEVEAGEVVAGLRFGNMEEDPQHAVLRGAKFNDRNLNSRWDDGEAPIRGWIVYLDLNDNDRYDPLEDRATRTGEEGRYQFRVRPGRYVVRELQREGWVQTRPDALHDFEYRVHVESGDEVEKLLFGNCRQFGHPADIAGRKFNDLDRNGEWDEGEPGLSHWLIYLDLNENGLFDGFTERGVSDEEAEPHRWTNREGRYRFKRVRPGTYHVREVLRPGWLQSYPGAPSFEHVVTVPDDPAIEAVAGVDFGNWPEGPIYEIEGWKFDDRDEDGEWDDDEPRLPGWLIYIDVNKNGRFDPHIDTATHTDERGHYVLPAGPVPPGFHTYVIREVVRPGWVQTLPGEEMGFQHTIELPQELPLPKLNFGNAVRHDPCGVAGRKFYDVNANGRMDPMEHGLAGWRIYADLNANGSHDSGEPLVETGERGWYELRLHPGEFVIREVMNRSYNQTLPGEKHGYAYKVRLRPGMWIKRLHFGNVFWDPGMLYGRKIYDGSTTPEIGEGLPGWVIYANSNENDVLDPGIDYATITGRDGRYRLALPPGTYDIREVLKPGWMQTIPEAPQNAYRVVIEGGEVEDGFLFGNRLGVSTPALITGRKLLAGPWKPDAEWMAGDAPRRLRGIPGWTIYLDMNSNGEFDEDVDRAVRTEQGGRYRFVVEPGRYVVREVVKPGWVQLWPDAAQGHEYVVELGPGDVAPHRHFVNRDRDSDEDGASDYEEEIVGTSPYDDSDVLGVNLVESGAGGTSLYIEAVNGHLYQLQSSTDLDNWSDVGGAVRAGQSGPLFFHIDVSAETICFYRAVAMDEE